MLNKKVAVLGLLTAVITVNILAAGADAKRKCPRGYEDINNICVFTGHR